MWGGSCSLLVCSHLHDEEDVVVDRVVHHLEEQHHVAVVQVAQDRDLALHLSIPSGEPRPTAIGLIHELRQLCCLTPNDLLAYGQGFCLAQHGRMTCPSWPTAARPSLAQPHSQPAKLSSRPPLTHQVLSGLDDDPRLIRHDALAEATQPVLAQHLPHAMTHPRPVKPVMKAATSPLHRHHPQAIARAHLDRILLVWRLADLPLHQLHAPERAWPAMTQAQQQPPRRGDKQARKAANGLVGRVSRHDPGPFTCTPTHQRPGAS